MSARVKEVFCYSTLQLLVYEDGCVRLSRTIVSPEYIGSVLLTPEEDAWLIEVMASRAKVRDL